MPMDKALQRCNFVLRADAYSQRLKILQNNEFRTAQSHWNVSVYTAYIETFGSTEMSKCDMAHYAGYWS